MVVVVGSWLVEVMVVVGKFSGPTIPFTQRERKKEELAAKLGAESIGKHWNLGQASGHRKTKNEKEFNRINKRTQGKKRKKRVFLAFDQQRRD